VINTALNVVAATVPAGVRPVALAELPNAQQVYVANLGDGTVSIISTTNDTVVGTIALGAGAKPVWAAARSDSGRVYVLDTSGIIYDINTLSNSILGVSSSVGAGANFLFYDGVLNRLYVTNPTNSQVAVLDAGVDPPRPLNLINLSLAAPSACLPSLGGCSPASVTVLGDGSRAYVASYQLVNCPGSSGNSFPCVTSQVEVIDGPSATLKSLIGKSAVRITGASQNASSTTYSYALDSALAPQAGDVIEISGMSDAGNNGFFLIASVASGTLTVTNTSGVSAANQNGAGLVPLQVGLPQNNTGCGPVSGPPPLVWQAGTARFRVFAGSSGGGPSSLFKVYVSQCDAGNVAILYTYPANGNPADSYLGLSLAAPLSSFPAPAGQAVPPPQNPVFLVAGP
jgi:YVTN family beta-propeller protein